MAAETHTSARAESAASFGAAEAALKTSAQGNCSSRRHHPLRRRKALPPNGPCTAASYLANCLYSAHTFTCRYSPGIELRCTCSGSVLVIRGNRTLHCVAHHHLHPMNVEHFGLDNWKIHMRRSLCYISRRLIISHHRLSKYFHIWLL